MAGPKIYKRCVACHSIDGKDGSGPSWGARKISGVESVWKRIKNGETKIGGGTKFQPGKTKLADYIGDGKLYATPEDYIRESIYNPGALLVDGYGNQMPTFQGQLNDRAIDAIIGMMQHLDEFNADGTFKDEARIVEAEERIEAAKAAAAEADAEEEVADEAGTTKTNEEVNE